MPGTPGPPTNLLIATDNGESYLAFFGATPGPRKVYSFAGGGGYKDTFSYTSPGEPVRIVNSRNDDYLVVQFDSNILDNYHVPDNSSFIFVGSSPQFDSLVAFCGMGSLSRYSVLGTKAGKKGIFVLLDTTANLTEEKFMALDYDGSSTAANSIVYIEGLDLHAVRMADNITYM